MKIILVLLCGCFLIGQKSVISEKQRQAIAALTSDINSAPDFSLKSLKDSTYTLSEMKGKVVLLNFWATWCGPCRMEIPDFNELYSELNKKGLEILGIAMDGTKSSLLNFQKSYRMDYPVLYGNPRDLNKISNEFGGIMALPTSILIGKKGEILKTYPGAIIKQMNPELYASFIYEIERALLKKKYD